MKGNRQDDNVVHTDSQWLTLDSVEIFQYESYVKDQLHDNKDLIWCKDPPKMTAKGASKTILTGTY